MPRVPLHRIRTLQPAMRLGIRGIVYYLRRCSPRDPRMARGGPAAVDEGVDARGEGRGVKGIMIYVVRP